MRTGFKPNTLGEAFVLKIKRDYDHAMKYAKSFDLETGESLYPDLLPFRGIEQVNAELKSNWQYLDIPISYLGGKQYKFYFPNDFSWDKYKPNDFEERIEQSVDWDNFEDYFTLNIVPSENPLIVIKARKMIYVMAYDHFTDTYYVSSLIEQEFSEPPSNWIENRKD